MTKNTRNLLIIVGVVAAGGVVAYFAMKKPAPALTAGVRRDVTITPGTPNVIVRANVGDTITVSLPSNAGAAWVAGDNTPAGAPGTATPISWTYQGPGTIILDWSTPTAGVQRTTLTFTTGA